MPWRSLLLAGVFAAGWIANEWRIGARIDSMRADHAEAIASAEVRARKIESGWHAALIEVQRDAHEKSQLLASDIDAERVSAERLRKQVAELSRRPAACPGVADGGEAADAARLVLADVLSRIDAAAGELAAYADRARVAGTACEAAYDLVGDG